MTVLLQHSFNVFNWSWPKPGVRELYLRNVWEKLPGLPLPQSMRLMRLNTNPVFLIQLILDNISWTSTVFDTLDLLHFPSIHAQGNYNQELLVGHEQHKSQLPQILDLTELSRSQGLCRQLQGGGQETENMTEIQQRCLTGGRGVLHPPRFIQIFKNWHVCSQDYKNLQRLCFKKSSFCTTNSTSSQDLTFLPTSNCFWFLLSSPKTHS